LAIEENLSEERSLTKRALKNGFDWEKIETMLRKHWSDSYIQRLKLKQTAPDLKLAETKKVLEFVRDNPTLGVCKSSRKLDIPERDFHRIKKEYKFDENGNIVKIAVK